ncbi:MAG: PAS domain-containing protein [Rhodospirillales bacterium]|nr:MAG: PAS domain-containing protein [Rhodospirillales bacterium]
MALGRHTFLAERVRLVFSDSWASLPINVINAGVVAFVHRDVLPLHVPLIWLAFILSIVALRVALYLWYRRSATAEADATVWARRLMAVLLLTGLGWGTGGVAMMSMSPQNYQVLIAFVLGGMAAGGMPSLSRIFTAYAVYAVPLLVPAIVYFALQGSELAISVAAMGTLLLVFLLAMGRRQESNIVDSMSIARENRNLVRDLRREIAEREEVELQLRHRENTLAHAQRIARMGSWEWDIANDRITSSPENSRLFGRSEDAPPYDFQKAMQAIHPDDRQRVETLIRKAVSESRAYSCDYRIALADGEERVIFEQADITSDDTGRAVLVTGINLDITDRYRAQERLRRAMQEAEAASDAKSQFLANMSHELRTPLNAIIGYSEILKEDAAAHDARSFVPDLEKINLAGRHLLELINDVLNLSRIEAGRAELVLEVIDVAAFANEVAATVQPLVSQNGNRFLLDCPPAIGNIRSDVTKLRQILYNLLSNAAKFTENGEIRLRISRFTDDAELGGAEWIRFTVCDTGIGIPAEDLETVFMAFERSEAGRGSRYDGTGLGLAICRHYCDMLGGAISVESAAGRGSEFVVRLPVHAQQKQAADVLIAK